MHAGFDLLEVALLLLGSELAPLEDCIHHALGVFAGFHAGNHEVEEFSSDARNAVSA